MTLIDPVQLRSLLGRAAGRFDVDVLPEAASSNDVLGARASAGVPSGSVVVVEHQYGGRGRRGRSWLASAGASLTFSLLWRFACPPQRLAGLSLVVGLAVVRGLRGFGVDGLALKWPNDILVKYGDGGFAKVGGILIEMSAHHQETAAVIGIGINLDAPGAVAGLPAAGLRTLRADLTADVVLAAILDELPELLDLLACEGFAPLAAAWSEFDAWRDQPVRLLEGETEQACGICRGVDADGALLIDQDGALRRQLSGDLSLRPA
jgi:BirA family transcriptional regulator, biotin operon repressor / biotin---[acetyl-CoA-carboxylase] ligase